MKWIFLNENVWISIEMSQKFVPRDPVNNILALVQIMGWWQAIRQGASYIRDFTVECRSKGAGRIVADVRSGTRHDLLYNT